MSSLIQMASNSKSASLKLVSKSILSKWVHCKGDTDIPSPSILPACNVCLICFLIPFFSLLFTHTHGFSDYLSLISNLQDTCLTLSSIGGVCHNLWLAAISVGIWSTSYNISLTHFISYDFLLFTIVMVLGVCCMCEYSCATVHVWRLWYCPQSNVV